MSVVVKEEIDLPGYLLGALPASAFSISVGQTLLGTLDPNQRWDRDSFWLNFDQDGQYRVTLERTNEGSLSQFALEIMDRQVATSLVATDDVLEVILNIGGETRRPGRVVALDMQVSVDYRISVEVDTIDGLNVEEDKIIFDANFEPTLAAEKIVADAYALPAGHRAFFTPGNGQAIHWDFEEAGYLLKFTESHYVYLTNFKMTDDLVDVIGFY
ncbi:hypothetical protein ACFO5X_06850 [Seohaeicola nanhaiensis]|uniref:DUF4178 domain-containing protein n=1 Tax=Seohaeicola nanhaiensis TaxID=1387282 RepID=A0ABV9KDT1_9RHOB